VSLEALKAALPAYAKDIKLNLSTLAADPTLSAEARAGTFIASALATRNAELTRAMVAEFGPAMSPEALEAAKASASVMAMNNIYYRFVHLVGGDYGRMPAKLRMSVIGKPGVAKEVFELWGLAVSAINGCGMCMEAHEKVVREHGFTAEQVQTAVRIAATVHALGAILDGAEARGETSIANIAA